jgi:hypothetical protein
MSRRVYLLGVAIALVALAFAVTDAVLGPRPGATEANVTRIRNGMTRKEVEAILGGKGSWGDRPGAPLMRDASWGIPQTHYHWVGANGYASVTFSWSISDGKEQVLDACFVRTASPSPLQRLRAWLGW